MKPEKEFFMLVKKKKLLKESFLGDRKAILQNLYTESFLAIYLEKNIVKIN